MTCYEKLRASAPAADAPMAHHFVKWWRNKFRNGYKNFNFGGDGERTDTEELIGRAMSQCSAPPDLLPSEVRARLQQTSPTCSKRRYELRSMNNGSPYVCDLEEQESNFRTSNSNESLKPKANDQSNKLISPPISPSQEKKVSSNKFNASRFEDLTCDVELQHSSPSKQQPLQFSFTLYDLEGHGRMTKDDIAGIVSTIYEAIGKSVSFPQHGSKTIQVRLTVVPEDTQSTTQTEKKDDKRQRRRKEKTAQPIPERGDQSEDEHRERLSDGYLSSKSSSSEERKPAQTPKPQICRPVLEPQINRSIPTQRLRTRHVPRREKRERKHTKPRSGSLQRRELLEIIQANMEKNHLSFQNSRKPKVSIGNEENIRCEKSRNKAHTHNEKPVDAFQKVNSDNQAHGYLDLSNAGGDSNLCHYDRYLHAVVCSSTRHANTGYHQKQTHAHAHRQCRPHHDHQRSRSNEPKEHAPTSPAPKQPRVLQIILL